MSDIPWINQINIVQCHMKFKCDTCDEEFAYKKSLTVETTISPKNMPVPNA